MNEAEHDGRRDQLAAYVLGALEPGEAAELERHLAGCEECRVDLGWLQPAAQLLPESVERLEPPAELRSSLMEQVRSEAERPPAPTRSARPHGLRLGLRPLAGLAAVVLIAAGIAGYAISGGGSGGDGTTTVIAGRSPDVTAELVRQGQTGTLHLANLRRLSRDEVLQAWVRRGERIVSAKTLFVPNADGTASATIDDMGDVNAVMVTAEPRGGSAQPTSAPIVSVAIPN